MTNSVTIYADFPCKNAISVEFPLGDVTVDLYFCNIMQIVNEKGERLYFTEDQRKALLAAAAKAPREVRSFCSVLCYTGCRISEALALTAKSIDLSAKVIVIESLKKRKQGVHRQVPVPPELLDILDMVHGIREIQKKGRARLNERLWTWSRMTAWRKMQALIKAAGIPDGPHACARKVCGTVLA
jgi:integrase/recombinase XerD